MNMFEEARSLAVMMKMRSLTQSETAKMLGVSQSYVANKLRLGKLEKEEQEIILKNNLSERHARAILRLKVKEERINALNTIAKRGLSVAESEALVDFLRIPEAAKTIGKGERLTCIEKFLSTTKESVKTLSSLGISVTQKISYLGRKTMITICIDEAK